MASTMDSVTELLVKSNAGDIDARGRLFQALYGELHKLARSQLNRAGNAAGTLDTTSLLHESYLKLIQGCRSVAVLSKSNTSSASIWRAWLHLNDYALQRFIDTSSAMALKISATASATLTALYKIATENTAAKERFINQTQHIAARKALHISLACDGVLMHDQTGADDWQRCSNAAPECAEKLAYTVTSALAIPAMIAVATKSKR
jgi:ECF sigma factor